VADDNPTPVDADNVDPPANADNVGNDPAPQDPPKADTPVPPSPLALPDDLKDHPSLKKFNLEEGVEGLAKSYVNLERLVGKEKVPIPETDSDWDMWFKAAGRPDTKDGYVFEEPKDIPEGMEFSQEMSDQFAEWAYDKGLNQTQAQGLRGDLMKYLGEAHEVQTRSVKERMEAAEAAIKREFGNAYEDKVKVAKGVVDRFMGDEFKEFLDDSQFGNDPRMIRGFANLAAKLGEDVNLTGQHDTLTPTDYKAQAAEFRTKNAAALMDKFHPDHNRLVKQLTNLTEKAFPGAAA